MKHYRLAVIGILALALLILVLPAGRRVFWSSNEARYPLLAQDILDHGRWVVPELRGQLYLNKPQLHFWSIAVASLPSGRVSELSGAIPSVLSALAMVGAVVAIGTLLWGGQAGLLAGLILTTAMPFFTFGHVAIPDMMLSAFMTWSLYWFLRAWRSEWARGPLVGFYLFVALAIAAKGPPGFAALAAVVVTTLGTDGPRGLVRLRPVLGLSILALCTLAWIVPYHLQSQGVFKSQVLAGHYGIWFFQRSVLARVTGLTDTLIAFFPWTVFLVTAPWWWRQAPLDDGRRRIVLWTLTLWLLFVFSGPVQAHYLLPVYPLLALLTAEFLARGDAQEGRRLLRVAAAVSLVCAMAVALALIVRPPEVLSAAHDINFFPDAWWERGLAAGIVVVGSIAAYLLARRDAWAAMTVTGALTIALILVLIGVGYPARYARAHDVRPLAAVAARSLAPGGTVVAYPALALSYDFYLRRLVVEVVSIDRMLATLASQTPGQVVIALRKDWEALIARAPTSWRVLATDTVDGREVVVAGSPTP